MDDETDGDRTAQGREIIENTPAGGNIGAVVTATDPNGAEDIMTHALGGPDAGPFTIDPGAGRLKTKAARDLEGRETCTVEVTATDSSNSGATAEVTIKVTDEDEAPEIMARNHGGRPGNIRVVRRPLDENGTSDAALAPWTLEGDHAGDFPVNAGMLTFSSSPD